MKILLTGASGFLGRHCLADLAGAGHEVHAVASRQISTDLSTTPNVQWHRADLLDDSRGAELMAAVRPTHWLHLAWTPTVPGRYWSTPDNYLWVRATLALFEAFAAQGGERAVFAGTCAEYEWGFGYCSEDETPLRPATTYGLCKNALRALLEDWARQASVSMAWARLFHLYGPDEYPQRLVSSTILSLLHGGTAQCSHGRQIRDFLHVHDASTALTHLLATNYSGAINVGSGQQVTIKEIVESIGDILGRSDRIEFGKLPSSPGDPPFLVADVTRLNRELDWKPSFDLQSGLRQTIEWWRQHEGITSS